jgi:hypothetical protein
MALLPPPPLRLLPAGTTKLAGWDLHPLKTQNFSRRTRQRRCINLSLNVHPRLFRDAAPVGQTGRYDTLPRVRCATLGYEIQHRWCCYPVPTVAY